VDPALVGGYATSSLVENEQGCSDLKALPDTLDVLLDPRAVLEDPDREGRVK
jgi:hypothetical protein